MTYPVGSPRDQKVNSFVRPGEEKSCQTPTRGKQGAPLIYEMKLNSGLVSNRARFYRTSAAFPTSRFLRDYSGHGNTHTLCRSKGP